MGARERCTLPGRRCRRALGGCSRGARPAGSGPPPSDGNRIPTRGTLPAPPRPALGGEPPRPPLPGFQVPEHQPCAPRPKYRARGQVPPPAGVHAWTLPTQKKGLSGLPGVLGKGRSALNGKGVPGAGEEASTGRVQHQIRGAQVPPGGWRADQERDLSAGRAALPSKHPPPEQAPQPHSATPREPQNPRPASTGAAL